MAVEGELLNDSREISAPSEGIVQQLNASEIDMQIATAKKFPRSVKQFHTKGTELVTLSEDVADECLYALRRSGKVIEGPSARFAEVAMTCWTNCRAGARVVAEEGDFVVAQGAFIDVEANIAVTYETRRRIVDKNGRRFNADMIGVTSNAACSIALRNAVLKGIPKAFWNPLYLAARKCAKGDVTTLEDKRNKMVAWFAAQGVTESQILEYMGKPGLMDVGLDDIVMLKGCATRIKEGESPEVVFTGTVSGADHDDALADAVQGDKPSQPDATFRNLCRAVFADCADIEALSTKASDFQNDPATTDSQQIVANEELERRAMELTS